MHATPFEIIYDDNTLLVINKIAKILVQPSDHNEKNTLTSLLRAKLTSPVYPCHRLDRETTGLIIYAKNRIAQEKMMHEFKTGKVIKKYFAFVKGEMKSHQGTLKGLILDKEGARHGERPKIAITHFKVHKIYQDFSLIELMPHTGRTNQLRIQLAQTGHPILGERMYAFGRDFSVNFKRLALHAYFLEFKHPQTSNILNFRIDFPLDMQTFLNGFQGLK